MKPTKKRHGSQAELPSINRLLEQLDGLSIQEVEEEKLSKHSDPGSEQELLGDEQPLNNEDRLASHQAAHRESRSTKEITLHSDVTFGPAGLSQGLHTKKVKYVRGERLFPERSGLVPMEPGLARTMAIRIPVEGSDQYINTHITTWMPLPGDDQLVAGLHEYLEDQLREKP
mgnify:FL=1